MTLVGLSSFPMLLFMTLKQFTDGLEYTKTAMMLSIAAMPVNIFLNWLLIYGHLGFPRTGTGWSRLCHTDHPHLDFCCAGPGLF